MQQRDEKYRLFGHLFEVDKNLKIVNRVRSSAAALVARAEGETMTFNGVPYFFGGTPPTEYSMDAGSTGKKTTSMKYAGSRGSCVF